MTTKLNETLAQLKQEHGDEWQMAAFKWWLYLLEEGTTSLSQFEQREALKPWVSNMVAAGIAATEQVHKPMADGLDAPTGPGWWAFVGGERIAVAIYSYGEGEDEEDRTVIEYKEVLGATIQTVLYVRYSKAGEPFRQWRQSGPCHGEPILGYLWSHHTWDHSLRAIDLLVGKWYLLDVPWEAT